MAAATQTQSNLDRQIDDAKRMHLAGDLKPAQKEYAKLLKKAPGNQRLLQKRVSHSWLIRKRIVVVGCHMFCSAFGGK